MFETEGGTYWSTVIISGYDEQYCLQVYGTSDSVLLIKKTESFCNQQQRFMVFKD